MDHALSARVLEGLGCGDSWEVCNNSTFPWWSSQELRLWPHFVLWYFATRASSAAELQGSRAAYRNVSAELMSLSGHSRSCCEGQLHDCASLWRVASGARAFDRALVRIAGSLLRCWAGTLAAVAELLPAFVVSVLLHAVTGTLNLWMSQRAAPADLWRDAQQMMQLSRELSAHLPKAEVSAWRLRYLDEKMHWRLQQKYANAVEVTLHERMHLLAIQELGLTSEMDRSFLIALREATDALSKIGVEYVPIQGTLIALLRYGTFPTGGLSGLKRDVVDNDAELMVAVANASAMRPLGRRISRALQARGWPPCVGESVWKLSCFSLHRLVPMKLEIYPYVPDHAAGLVRSERSTQFPFQKWAGGLPWAVFYPLGSCRLGSRAWQVPCPRRPVAFLSGYNDGEYGSSSCLAVPVLTKDRDAGDSRNVHLGEEGLNLEDLAHLAGRARVLDEQGFSSFHAHLHDPPCQSRASLILAGDGHSGLHA